MAITVILNGKKEDVKDGMTIAELLALRKIRPEVVTVELNDNILERAKYNETTLKQSDRIEFVYYMGGGYAI